MLETFLSPGRRSSLAHVPGLQILFFPFPDRSPFLLFSPDVLLQGLPLLRKGGHLPRSLEYERNRVMRRITPAPFGPCYDVILSPFFPHLSFPFSTSSKRLLSRRAPRGALCWRNFELSYAHRAPHGEEVLVAGQSVLLRPNLPFLPILLRPNGT